MRHYTKKRAAQNRAADQVRDELKEQVRRCEVCLRTREPKNLAGHEIASGSGLRLKALDKRFAVLIVCRHPNFDGAGPTCHQQVQNESEARQLARLYMNRQADFNLAEYNRLVNPKAPDRITQAEVDAEIANLLSLRPTVTTKDFQ